jgi:hypothetical protein
MSLPRFFHDRPRTFWILLLLVLGLSVWGITRLRFQTDMMRMMPKDDPVFSAFEKSVRHFGGIDNLIVVVRVDPEADLEEYLAFADSLAAHLGRMDEPVIVTWRLPDPKPYLTLFLSNIVVLSAEEEWAALKGRFQPESLKRTLMETRIESQSFLAPGIKEFLALDPLRLHRVYQERFSGVEGTFRVDVTSGYLLSTDHRMLLLIVKPPGTAQDIDYARRLIGKVRAELETTLAEFREGDFHPDVELGGGFRIAAEDAALIRGDMLVQILSTLIAVLLLFLLCFGRVSALVFAFLPLVLGLVVTYGFTGWVLRDLNMASSSFAALLIGLGIDFIIVFYGRYVEERTGGLDFFPALDLVGREVYPCIFWGAVTTMATFGVFLVVQLRGLKELGFLTAAGIFFVMAITFTVFPAVLYFDEKFHHWRNRFPRLRISSFGMEALTRGSIRHARRIVAGGLILGAGMALLALGLPFMDDAQSIRSKGNRGIVLQKEIQGHFGENVYPSVALMESADPMQIFARDAELGTFLDGLQKREIVARHIGLSSFIPPPDAQARALRRAGEVDLDRWKADFDAACRGLGLEAGAFTPFWSALVKGVREARVLDWEAISGEDMRSILSTLTARSNGQYLALHSIYYHGEAYRREAPPELEEWIRNRPGYVLTGINVMAKHLRQTVKADAFKATVLGLLLVCILLYLDFRSVKLVVWSLLPLALGISFMLGCMRLLGMALNSLNIYVSAMVIGIGVDYGIHILHRHRLSGGDFHQVAQTGKAVFFAALTTIAGFGSLIFSHFPGLRSMGFVAVFGTAFCALFALTFLPALLHLRDRKAG